MGAIDPTFYKLLHYMFHRIVWFAFQKNQNALPWAHEQLLSVAVISAAVVPLSFNGRYIKALSADSRDSSCM